MLKNVDDNALTMVSLLSASTGLLEVVVIPNEKGIDWLLPKNNILDIAEENQHKIKMFWKNIELPILDLTEGRPEHVVVCEGVSDVHRIGLLVRGKLMQHKLRISDIPDSEHATDFPYSFAQVVLQDEQYMVPDMDALARDFVELD